MSNLKSQIAFAGGNAEIWSHETSKYDDEAGTITVDTNVLKGGLNEAMYSNQRTLLTRMRGWGLTSESGIDIYTSPQKLAEQKSEQAAKSNGDMLEKLRRNLPKDRSSLWNSEGVVKSNSEGEEGVYLDLTKHEDQSYITDRVFRDLDYLRKAGWTTAFCRTGALWVHVTPPIEVQKYSSATAALAAVVGDEEWTKYGIEEQADVIYFHADRMSEADFNNALRFASEAKRYGWTARPIPKGLQRSTGMTEYDKVRVVASERVLTDA